MKLYIAGPMTGHKDLNFPLFCEVARALRECGHEVVNPAELNVGNGDWLSCMRNDIAHLVTCDGVATLAGWSKSRGASLEVHIAEKLGLDVMVWESWARVTA